MDVWQLSVGCWLFLVGLFDQLKMLVVLLAFKLAKKSSVYGDVW